MTETFLKVVGLQFISSSFSFFFSFFFFSFFLLFFSFYGKPQISLVN